MSTRLERRVVAKTADYTIKPPMDRPGTTFTNRGATATVVFTLPAANRGAAGHWYRFKTLAAFTVRVAAPVGGTVVTFNNAAAASVTASTAGQLIGADMEAFCDGTSWFVIGMTVGVTYTVA